MARSDVAWAVGNRVAVYRSSSRDSRATGQKTAINVVEWETTLYQPIWRKLVNEAAQTFVALQTMAKEEESLSTEQLLNISRQYRSILRDCQEQMDSLSEEASVQDPVKEQYLQQSELLYKLELIWNLMEVLCIEKSPSGIVLPQLLQWISMHFPHCDDKARSILSESPEAPDTHPDYWDTLTAFVLQGRTDQARNILRLHSDFSAEPFSSMDELLRKMPSYNPKSSAADFDFRWRHWQTEVLARIDESDFAAYEELVLLANILAGSESTFHEITDKFETWYEWMVAKLLFKNPTVKAYDLPLHAEQSISRFGGLNNMTALDSILLAAMETDIPQVMHELCSLLDNLWFPSHLLDLLHHTDHSSNSDTELVPNAELREFLLLEYGTCLMTHHSLWQVGVTYLDHCPVQGRFRTELMLERIPLETERKAGKIIGVATERGMVSVVATVCKVMGMKALRQDRVGSAMTWGLRSQDAQFTTFLADRLLQQYTDEGGFTSTDLLDNLGSSMVVSDRLTFLAKYREFHKLCQNSDFPTAATLLHSLLWSRLAPKYFWVTLLIDALPFLNTGDLFFTSDQNYELMHCLQELSNDTSLPKKQRVLLEESEGRIRMGLAKNLAMALMNEGDEGGTTV